uniref:DUF4387 family protein n=1 Tax=Haemonchus contortus TaxID=6289 RepID=A0A7I4Z2F8_HAECO
MSTALGAHRVETHYGADFEVTAEVLARESQTPTQKILEAFWIQVTRPKLNRREECLTIKAVYKVGLPPVSLNHIQSGKLTGPLLASKWSRGSE